MATTPVSIITPAFIQSLRGLADCEAKRIPRPPNPTRPTPPMAIRSPIAFIIKIVLARLLKDNLRITYSPNGKFKVTIEPLIETNSTRLGVPPRYNSLAIMTAVSYSEGIGRYGMNRKCQPMLS